MSQNSKFINSKVTKQQVYQQQGNLAAIHENTLTNICNLYTEYIITAVCVQ